MDNPMPPPKPIKPHSPEEQVEICKAAGIPLEEYDRWLRNQNWVQCELYKLKSEKLYAKEHPEEFQDKPPKVERKPKEVESITLKMTMKLFGIEDWSLTHEMGKYVVKRAIELLQHHQAKWFQKNQKRLHSELQLMFRACYSER